MRWIVPIMGFRESRSNRTGMERVWSELRRYASPQTCVVTPWEWSDDMAELRDFILRNSSGMAPRVMVVAYSWGAGVGAVGLAWRCWEAGIDIDTACLADPVYRSKILPTWLPFNPLSLTRIPKIGVPPSIKAVRWVRQRNSRPAGHDLYAVLPTETRIEEPVMVDAPHRFADESREYLSMCLEESERFVSRGAEKI